MPNVFEKCFFDKTFVHKLSAESFKKDKVSCSRKANNYKMDSEIAAEGH